MTDLNLPIDIHSSKLLDWLISRRHVKKEWPQAVLMIREKINQAIQDMPEHPGILELLAGTYINYFHCCRIVDILRETESDTKNFFGRYSSQRMKDWQEIVALYQNDGTYLAEAAQILQRFVTYDIQSLKKQIAKCHQSIEESKTKENDYLKQAKDAERLFSAECSKMGIKGDKIEFELVQLSQNLPEFLERVSEKSKKLTDSVKVYTSMRDFLLSGRSDYAELVPLLRFVMTHGNVTHYQWKFGTSPSRVDSSTLESYMTTNNAAEGEDDQIDFGDGEIDFGTDAEAGDESGIDFGDSTTALDAVGICLVEEEVVSVGQNSGSEPPSDKVARGDDALTILEHPTTQKQFLLDLQELAAFLRTRKHCVKHAHTADFLTSQSMDPSLHLSEGDIESMLMDVEKILGDMQDPYKRHLFKIKSSRKYLDQLVKELNIKKGLRQKFERMSVLAIEKQEDLAAETVQLNAKLQLTVRRVKELQKQIEAEIGKKYKGRPVNIMGGVTAAVS